MHGIYAYDTKVSLDMKEANAKLKVLLKRIKRDEENGGI